MAIVWSSTFTSDTWTDWTNPNPPFDPPDTVSNHIIAGWGCSGGAAYTCSNNVQERVFTPSTYTIGVIPDSLLQSTTRVSFALGPVGAQPIFFDFTSSPTHKAWNVLGWALYNADRSLSIADQSAELLNIWADGTVELAISDGFSVNPSYFTSAAGAFPVDTLQHGIQVLLNYTSTSSLTYTVVVDNVTVISGTMAAHAGAWTVDTGIAKGQSGSGITIGRAGVNSLTLRASNLIPFGTTAMSAAGAIEVDDTATIADYPGCSAVALDVTAACSPYVPPVPPTSLLPIRRARAFMIPDNNQQWVFFKALQIYLETGIGNDDAPDPQIHLRWSDDAGHTWSNYRTVSAGVSGAYSVRALWRQLGRARNRVFEFYVDDPVAWSAIQAYVDAEGGIS